MKWIAVMLPSVEGITIVLILLRLAAELLLSELNRREVRRHASTPPPVVAAAIDGETYRKSVAYTLAKNRLGEIEVIVDAGVLVLVLFSGVLPALYALTSVWSQDGVWDDALFILMAGAMLWLPGLPIEWWSQFKIEAHFGFNTSTLRLWAADQVKGVLLAFGIGFPLLWMLLSLVRWMGSAWWIAGFALVFGFQLLMLVLYPKLILPLFNKLTPLPAGPLRDRLMALAHRTGFRASTIEVIDGSRRSGHSNAFFTGFGRFRRIVLFDTLLAQLTPEELEAVLAHEVGHYKRGHVPKLLALSAFMQLGAFAAVGWLARSAWFNAAFGLPSGEIAPSLVLFGLLSGLVVFWCSPAVNLLSRRFEYEADAFARAALGGPGPMIDALRKLAQENLSNLTPHPWFSRFYYSHPTLIERERALAA